METPVSEAKSVEPEAHVGEYREGKTTDYSADVADILKRYPDLGAK